MFVASQKNVTKKKPFLALSLIDVSYTYARLLRIQKMQKRVTISIDESLNDRWGKVAKKHKITKSVLVQDFLEEILPILEAETANKMVARSMRKMAESIDLSSSLFDDSVEDYKEMKRG